MNVFMIDNTSICKINVFIALLCKKSVVNSKLKTMIEKKNNNKMCEDVSGEIKLIRILNLVKKCYDLVYVRSFFSLFSWC